RRPCAGPPPGTRGAAPGKHTGAGCAPEHTAADAHHAGAAHIIEPIGLAGGDRRRRAQAAAHRRADALAPIASRESGRIAGDEGVVAAHDFDAAAQVVAVAGRLVAGAGSKASLERRREVRPVRPDVLPAALHALGDAAHPDVEPAVLLRHVPRVTGQSLLEEPQVTVAIPPVVLELVLQRDDLQLARSRVQVAEERTVHRTARAAGADQPAAAEGVVDDEARAVGGDVTHVVLLERRARALEPAGPPPTMSASHERMRRAAQPVYRCARVHGTSLLSPGANSTWNSCSVPQAKPAAEPAR